MLPGPGEDLGHMYALFRSSPNRKIRRLADWTIGPRITGCREKRIKRWFLDWRPTQRREKEAYKIYDIERGAHALTSGLGFHAMICIAYQSMRLLCRLGVMAWFDVVVIKALYRQTNAIRVDYHRTDDVGNSASTAKETDELTAMS